MDGSGVFRLGKQLVHFVHHLLLQGLHVLGVADQDGFHAVLDGLGDGQAVVARIGEPLGQQGQLLDRRFLVRILLVEVHQDLFVGGLVGRNVARGACHGGRTLAGGDELHEGPGGLEHFGILAVGDEHRRVAAGRQGFRRAVDALEGGGAEGPVAGLVAVHEADGGGGGEVHADLPGREGLAGIGIGIVLHLAAVEDALHGLEALQAGLVVEVEAAVLDGGLALAPQQRLQEPVAGDVPVPEDRLVIGVGVDLLADLDDAVPGLGYLFDAGFLQDVHVVVADGRGDREGQAVDLAVEGGEIQHGFVIAILLEIRFLFDEGLQ